MRLFIYLYIFRREPSFIFNLFIFHACKPAQIFPSRFKCVPVYGISHANASTIEIRFAACLLVNPNPRNRVKVNKNRGLGWILLLFCQAS